ncbi:MAG: DUF3891 family protein [Phycisphaerales bacterium]|nr:DUF3891 family protein [Phycisphaerales bacterium]
MLHRRAPQGIVAISQPAHAWVSGQIAAVWGEPPDRREEMVLAALLHDIGWTEWEQHPTFNSQTGWPHTFLELDTRSHVAIWSQVWRRVEAASALAALLVSRHGTGLYKRYHGAAEAPGTDPLVREYLEREQQAQAALLAKVRAASTRSAAMDEAWLERASELIAAWDWMSLILCMNASDRGEVKGVPWRGARIDLQLSRVDEERWRATPWVFAPKQVRLVMEGRALSRSARDEAEMHAMLDAAPLVEIEVTMMGD